MNFTRVERSCYHFSDRQYNWKSGSSMCKSLGSNLLEVETPEEYSEIVTYLSSVPSLRENDYWTGGLNPGLLWI
ncbi:C-type lectin domain family 7 member A-like [Lycorma delicatula]|uniref:C-type lectin domain family 7 member A-like n=1 Tax=Lycorma delicatula TaxID=130591 RepID=UPI003F519897